ncbi:multidrug effflux MFS transporter [Methylophilaceae bacterium]|jgi:DHA1 family bicyclomycin/chloramphenicol resistance-like MFS transporter|nr:multidrug effflux MFS transporter [Methylophilaceae bacterium]|tara:strand:- start:1676 stop:2854 length:1179 start_codon:yes stop_codon:yes gene_type:complete
MSLFLNPRVITLAALTSVAPFAIDTYLPGFHILSKDLLATPEAIQQTLTFYLLPYTIMLLFHGPISDGVGRIKTMQWGLMLFLFASLGCAFSTTVESLWFFRALQGIGGGAGSVVARAMVRDLYKGAEAQRVMATVQMLFGIAPAIAPMIGGLLLGFHWQSIFIFLALYAAVAIFMGSKILPETMKKNMLVPISFNSIITRYKLLLTNKEYICLILSLSANFSAFFIYVLASPIFLIDHLGFTTQQFGYLFIPTVSGMLIGSFIAKKTAGVVRSSLVLKYGYYFMFFISLLNLLFCSLMPDNAFFNIGFIALYNIGMASVMPIISLAGLDCFPKIRGTAASGQAFTQMLFASIVAGLLVPILWFSTFGLSLGLFFLISFGFTTITKTNLWKL